MTSKGIPKEFLFLVGLIAVTLIGSYALQQVLPKAVKKPSKSIRDVPIEWEVKFKDLVKDYIAHDSKILRDPVLGQATDKITTRLLRHIDPTPYEIEVILVDSPVVNALAFPGGLIVVFAPLVRLTSSPEELAGVIAHELGHVKHRDPLRSMIRQFGISVVFSILKGGETTAFLETMVRRMVELRYTREMEAQADTFGLDLMEKAGIDPIHFATFMKKLQAEGEKDSPRMVKYLRTHPLTQDRIDLAEQRSKEFSSTEKPFKLNWKKVKKHLPSIF